MKRYKIDDAAFNITNVCNLTCNGCESFNNYNFKGHMKFADYKNHYQRWSELCNINQVTIHGGEPFTNKDIVTWAVGLKQLWPNAKEYFVATNGTLLEPNKETVKKVIKLGYYLNITVHDPAMLKDIVRQLKFVLDGIDYKVRTDVSNGAILYYNGEQCVAMLEKTYDFKSSAIDIIKDKTWYMHNSNINDAYNVCLEDAGPCSFFHKGYLYQCQLTGLKDDLFLQFSIEPRAVDLLNQYTAGDPFAPAEQLNKFFETFQTAIPQCTLCPGCPDTHAIYPMATKKVKF